MIKYQRTLFLVFLQMFLLTQAFCQSQINICDEYPLNPQIQNEAYKMPLIGRLSTYYSGSSINSPYFGTEQYHTGCVLMKNTIYKQVEIRFNIYNQTLEVLSQDNQNTSYGIVPPTEFITAFSYNTKTFKRKDYNGTSKFYQVIHSGEITCLYYWSKKRSQATSNGVSNRYDYHKAKSKRYLVISEQWMEYHSSKSFLKHFNKELQKKIATYIKSNDIHLLKSSDSEISALITFCQNLLTSK